MWTRAELKDNAKKYFKFNYWKMVLVALVMSMTGGGVGGGVSFRFTGGGSSGSSGYPTMSETEFAALAVGILVVVLVIFIIAAAMGAFLFNPLRVGAQRFFVVSHYQKAELGEIGYAFSNHYMNVVKTMFLLQLYVFLWSLLFIIPGIIKGYEYRMIPYILAEHPDIDSKQAFAMSRQMMDGNKWNAFVLDLSFLGWILLSCLTCGILPIFYVNPYIMMTDAELYVALKEITFGNNNGSYLMNQGFSAQQSYQNYQPYQNYQGYQNQNNQWYQDNQGAQGYPNYSQNGQNYQGTQNYQDYQTYDQNSQGYQDAQNYRQDYQNGGAYGYQQGVERNEGNASQERQNPDAGPYDNSGQDGNFGM